MCSRGGECRLMPVNRTQTWSEKPRCALTRGGVVVIIRNIEQDGAFFIAADLRARGAYAHTVPTLSYRVRLAAGATPPPHPRPDGLAPPMNFKQRDDDFSTHHFPDLDRFGELRAAVP